MLYKETILVVDDEKSNIDFIASILTKDYNVKTAPNGKVAIDILKKFNIDLVITDIEMPIMNGIELVKEMKRLDLSADIIIISAHADTNYLLGAINEGINKYILKPINKMNLTLNVAKTLNYRKLQEERKLFDKILNENVLYYKLDLQGNIVEVSDALVTLTGYSKEEYLSKDIFTLHSEIYTQEEINKDQIWEKISNGKEYVGEHEAKKKSGEHYYVKLCAYPLFNFNEKIGYVVIKTDITLEKVFEKLSIKDSLTNAYNRRYFNIKMTEYLNIAKRDKRQLSFLMFDIDHFKLYNDNYGHLKGDEVLVKISKAIHDTLKRSDDIFFRLGGEEFGILYRSEDKDSAIKFAEIIKKAIDDLKIEHKYSKISEYVTISIGLITIDHSSLVNNDKLYLLTDNMLYKAKNSGRDKIEYNM